MIALLIDLVRLFARDGLTVDDVVRAMGPIAKDPGVPMPMVLQPTAHGVSAASLARYPDTLLPYLLTLDYDGNARPTVGDLTSEFGTFRVLPRDRGMPMRLRFAPVTSPSRWTVALVANLAGSTPPTADEHVPTLMLQREPVLTPTDAPKPEAHP